MINFYEHTSRTVGNMITGQRGAALIDYMLIISLISLVALAALTPLGQKISQMFGTIVTQIP